MANFNVKIGDWTLICYGCGSLPHFCSDEFFSAWLEIKSCLRPNIDTIRAVPMNSTDLMYVHIMFQLLYVGKEKSECRTVKNLIYTYFGERFDFCQSQN